MLDTDLLFSLQLEKPRILARNGPLEKLNSGLTIPNVEIQIRRKYADPQLKKKENLLLLDHALVHVGDLLLH